MIWTFQKINKIVIGKLNGTYKLLKPILVILINRGYIDKRSIASFIYVSYNQLHSPWLFETMKSAVDLLLKHKENKILIYGDSDVDGITATAFLTKVLNDVGFNVEYYIPTRSYEEYGLTKEYIDTIKKSNVQLIITVDTGINSIEEIEYARECGVEVIVTDHHRIVTEQEEPFLMINPKVSETYPFNDLSGVGVAFKFAQGVYDYLGVKPEGLYRYIDLVMLGTIADVVSLESENRVIVRKGLEQIKKSEFRGLRYLLNYLKLNHKELTTADISFYVAPLINALGRTGKAMLAVDFLLEKSDSRLFQIIEEMKEANLKRRHIEKHTYDEILKSKEFERYANKQYIFLKSALWNPCILGVLASKLSLKYKKPVMLITVRNSFAKASCRSVEGINIFDTLSSAKDEFIRFGGHNLAAGFVSIVEKLPIIEEKIAKSLENCYYKSVVEELIIDTELQFKELSPTFMRQLGKLLPFPNGNKSPLFFTKDVNLYNIYYFGQKKQHFTATVKQGPHVYSATGFNLGERLQGYKDNITYDIIY
ncbi:MAG: single-stranded-DNA-specific exonuclease RecJ, partial [Fusobacteria bacterium]|nr:single-stranded-DNA-specific exonuclease RecJ [Fusobacteriota bacterium]